MFFCCFCSILVLRVTQNYSLQVISNIAAIIGLIMFCFFWRGGFLKKNRFWAALCWNG